MSPAATTDLLEGRVAIVTGASSGLGARFAAVLAQAGARVIACARRIERLDELARSQPGIVPSAATSPTPATAPSSSIMRCASLTHRYLCQQCRDGLRVSRSRDARRPALRDRHQCRSGIRRNQAVAEPMIAAGSGSIINISSMFGSVAATPVPDAPYVASKSAVNGLTRELANQWAPLGVRVNAIAPGWF